MTTSFYYYLLKKADIPATNAVLSIDKSYFVARLSSIEKVKEGYLINGRIILAGVKIVPIDYEVNPSLTQVLTHRIIEDPSIHIVRKRITGGEYNKGGRQSSGRIPLHNTSIPSWIEKLSIEGELNYFDEFDLDNVRPTKIVVRGAAMKYASHNQSLVDLFFRPGLELVDGLLTYVEGRDNGGMSRDDVEKFLNIKRTGDRANWWFIYQVSLKPEYANRLSEAPWRTLVIYRKDDILLTIPVAYPNASGEVKHNGSRVWDPF